MKRRLISLPFFLLRTTTAGAAFVTGLVQTFVFAHVLSPERFSIFILVAAVGYSLWLVDLGIVKILFVRLRARFLSGERGGAAAAHATAVVLFYFVLVICGGAICFAVTALYSPPLHAAEFALFFLFIALNLVWYALRNISIAVDEYVLFEALETMRRGGYFIGLAMVYAGLPLIVMLLAVNALWAAVLFICGGRLVSRGAVIAQISGVMGDLHAFFLANRTELARSGAYAASEIFVYNSPYFIVSMLFGLGAAPIIVDTTFKVFRGGANIFGAVCDILVPRQTSALAERDGPTLVKATIIAAVLCTIPAAAACTILIFGAGPLFSFLLGKAATMPPAITPILIVLVLANLTQMVTHSVLVHNGYFREVARLGGAVSLAMTALAGYTILGHLDTVGFLAGYATVYACGALAAVVLTIRGPIEFAYGPGSEPKVARR